MMHSLDQEFISEYKKKDQLTERERLEITIKAWRQAQKMWNFFWESAKQVNAAWKHPFIIRMRHWKDKKVLSE